MLKKYSLFLIYFFLVALVYGNKPRLYPFINDEPEMSYFSIDAGTGLNLSLIDKNVEVSFGYDYVFNKGFILSTDIYLFNFKKKYMSFLIGLGGCIIFNSSLDMGFDSKMYLRIPLVLEYKNFYIKLIPMAGTHMFKSYFEPLVSGYAGIGYKFDLFNEQPSNATKK